MNNINHILQTVNLINKANTPHVKNSYVGYDEMKENDLQLSRASKANYPAFYTPNPFSKDPKTTNEIAELLYSFELEKINAEKKTSDGMNPRTKYGVKIPNATAQRISQILNEFELELGSFFTESSANKGNTILKSIKKFNELKNAYEENINDIVSDTHFKTYVFNVKIVQSEKLVKTLKFAIHNMNKSQPLAQGDISLVTYEQAVDDMLSAIQIMIEGKPLSSSNVSIIADRIKVNEEGEEGEDNGHDNGDDNGDDNEDDGHEEHEGHENHHGSEHGEDSEDSEHSGDESDDGLDEEDILRLERERREQADEEERLRLVEASRVAEEERVKREQEENTRYMLATEFEGMPNLADSDSDHERYYADVEKFTTTEILQYIKVQLENVDNTTDRFVPMFWHYLRIEVTVYIQKLVFEIPKVGKTTKEIVEACLFKARGNILPLFPDIESLKTELQDNMTAYYNYLDTEMLSTDTLFSDSLAGYFNSVNPQWDTQKDVVSNDFEGMPPFALSVADEDYLDEIYKYDMKKIKTNMDTQVSSIDKVTDPTELVDFIRYFTLEAIVLSMWLAKDIATTSKTRVTEEQILGETIEEMKYFLTEIQPLTRAKKDLYNRNLYDKLIAELNDPSSLFVVECKRVIAVFVEERNKEIEATPVKVPRPRPPREPTQVTPMGPLVQDDEPHPEPAGPYNNATTKQNWDFEQEEYAKLKTYARSHPQPEYALKFLDRSKQALKDVIKFYLGYKYEFREGVGYVKTDEKIEKRYYDRLMNPTTYSEFTGGNGTLLQKLYNRIKAHHPEKRILFTKTSFKVFIDLLPSFNKKFQEVTGLPPRSQVYKFFGYHPVSRPRRT